METRSEPPLSDSLREQAQRHFRLFFWLNGIAVACVMENILLLWALQNGISPPRVAIISSFTFLAMPFMALGKRLSASLGLVRAKRLCWTTRYLFIILMLPVPWVRQALSPATVFWIIAACTFSFFVFRSMGMINIVPLMGAAAGPRNMGSFQAGIGMRSNLSYFITLVVVIGALRGRDNPGVYQVILAAGSLVGLFSVRMLRGIPEPSDLRLGARVRIRTLAREVWRTPTFFRLALAWSATTMGIALIIPIAMLALKQGYGIADNAALGFTLSELAGTIAAAAAMTLIADHTGPRPIILLSMMLFLCAAGFWAFAPVSFYPVPVGIVFFLGGMGRGGLLFGLTHYLLATSTSKNRFGVGLFMHMVSGALSGVAGTVIGGGLLGLLASYAGEGLLLYQVYYRIILIVTLGLTFIAALLPRLKDWAIHDIIGLIFSFNDLRALVTLNRLRQAVTDDDDEKHLDRLITLNSRYTEPMLAEFLQAGRLTSRAQAIQALSRIPFGEATSQALIREVREGAFTNGWRAAELLGQRRIIEAVPALREGLESDDPFLAGKCMVALARMKDKATEDRIRNLFHASGNPRIVIHGARALEIFRDEHDLERVLDKCVEREWSQPVLDELLMAAASLCGKKRQAYRQLRVAAEPDEIPDSAPALPDSHSKFSILRSFLSRHSWRSLPVRMRLTLIELAKS